MKKCRRGPIFSATLTAVIITLIVYLYNRDGSGCMHVCKKPLQEHSISNSSLSPSITYIQPSQETLMRSDTPPTSMTTMYTQRSHVTLAESSHVTLSESQSESVPTEASVAILTISSIPPVKGSSDTRKVLIRAPPHCVQMNCREHLSAGELGGLRSCELRVRKVEHMMGPISNNDCKFLPMAGRVPVALLSARGSGNTWTRGLLERASGICTGFIFCDAVLRAHGYVGESVKSGKVLVVKTHSPNPKWVGGNNSNTIRADALYGSAIFILRNPFRSVIAEWNRRSAQEILGKDNSTIFQERHTYVVPQELFNGTKWKNFVKWYMKDWKLRIHQWVIDQDKYPVHILRYEDLQKNTLEEILRVLDFLNVSYDYDTVAERLREDYSEFHRPHKTVESEHYSDEQKQQLRSWFMDIIIAAENAGKSHLLQLDEYLSALSS